jgi:hypothetical protein
MYSHLVMLVDSILALALLVTMVYLARIRRDIRNIRHYQKDLNHFSHNFSDAIKRSEQTLKNLYAQKEILEKEMRTTTRHTEVLLEDLRYAAERAEGLFRRLSRIPLAAGNHTHEEDAAGNITLHDERVETVAEEEDISSLRRGKPSRTAALHSTAQGKRREALRKVLSQLK